MALLSNGASDAIALNALLIVLMASATVPPSVVNAAYRIVKPLDVPSPALTNAASAGVAQAARR